VKVLLVESGAAWGTAEVEAGLAVGLAAHGVALLRYPLAGRLARAGRMLTAEWRHLGTDRPGPTSGDVLYHASKDALITALREEVDVVLVVAAILFSPDVLILMARAGLPVGLVLTEAPYDLGRELEYAAYAAGSWTTERSVVPALRAVTPRAGYLAHAWHPAIHTPAPRPDDAAVPAHDVVIVGTGFADRIAWLEAIDWTGIDLGLYGHWAGLLPKRSKLKKFVRAYTTANTTAAALYRRARVGINLYRQRAALDASGPVLVGESCNPRAFEMAACGLPHVSTYRPEVAEVFGDAVPVVTTPAEGAAAVRALLDEAPAARAVRSAALVDAVRGASWIDRAAMVYADLQSLAPAA
jgi:glycosyltransferase involved in cell wall biosynthesis